MNIWNGFQPSIDVKCVRSILTDVSPFEYLKVTKNIPILDCHINQQEWMVQEISEK